MVIKSVTLFFYKQRKATLVYYTLFIKMLESLCPRISWPKHKVSQQEITHSFYLVVIKQLLVHQSMSISFIISCLREFLLFYCAVLITNSLAYSNVQVVLELIRPQLTSLRVVLVLPHHLESLSKIITKLCTEKHTNI